ncbi:MAG: hypothetical protein IJ144_04335 [Prevotella sp.]|nr:hypothetical protein [Prevotella sp.]
MKKMMTTLTILLLTAVTANAMSYEQARNEALFLTDKMAYELNLTDEQYEAAYEINLDYLMGVTSYDDVYGTYWERRNLDMSYVLLDWQWNAFCAATYFYRPLYWTNGVWHFGIYARYPRRDYFYFGRPVFYASYRGGHAWHHVGGRGYYYHHTSHYRPTGRSHFGMLDRWNRGDFHHSNPNGHFGNGRSHFGGNRNSSTRTTVNHHGYTPHNNGTHSNGSFGNGTHSNGSFGNGTHSNGSFSNTKSRPASSFSRTTTTSAANRGATLGTGRSSGSFSGSRSSSSLGSGRSSGSFSGSHSSGGSFGRGSSGGSFSRGSSGGSFSRGSSGGGSGRGNSSVQRNGSFSR